MEHASATNSQDRLRFAKPKSLSIDGPPTYFTFSTEDCREVLYRSGTLGHLDRLLSNTARLNSLDLSRRAKEAERIVYDALCDKTMADLITSKCRALYPNGKIEGPFKVSCFAGLQRQPNQVGQRKVCEYSQVRGQDGLLEAIKHCIAELFDPNGIVSCLQTGERPLDSKPFVVVSRDFNYL